LITQGRKLREAERRHVVWCVNLIEIQLDHGAVRARAPDKPRVYLGSSNLRGQAGQEGVLLHRVPQRSIEGFLFQHTQEGRGVYFNILFYNVHFYTNRKGRERDYYEPDAKVRMVDL
jgi:hypothetical protein